MIIITMNWNNMCEYLLPAVNILPEYSATKHFRCLKAELILTLNIIVKIFPKQNMLCFARIFDLCYKKTITLKCPV